ncbi:helix-turn-helix domain-containing protein [Sphingopyxis sp.]|uniref:helix-turn-helix domain-containing protein n=1 Tax=Sphingopyxis sp. TaxID=1908224 RepID=UPI003D0FF7C7
MTAGRSSRTARPNILPEISVRDIRMRQGLSQIAFARRFGLNIHTLRQWEQGLREPEGPARTYLTVIDRIPGAVASALETP